jgi:glycosyltransferase involved in cell wall biosynthesis
MTNRQPLKILLATGIFPPAIGGPATYAKLLTEHLPPLGFKVEVLDFGKVRHLFKGLRHFVYFLKLLKRGFKTDFIFAQDTLSVAWPAALAAGFLRKKFIIRVPGDYVWEQSVQRFGVTDGIDEFQQKKYGFKVECLRKLQNWSVGRAQLVIAPSRYFRKLVAGWVKNPDRVVTIYNGLDLPEENFSPKNYSAKDKLIISAGRLVPWKGFAGLIELMNQLPDWHLAIYGSGPQENVLAKEIERLNLKNRVSLKGSVPKAELRQAAKRARIFILNTSFESFSYQVVEMMSLGVPVITANIGNLPEIITNRAEGLLVEPDNLLQLKEAVRLIDEDSSFRESLVKQAALKARDFSVAKSLNQLANSLRNLL